MQSDDKPIDNRIIETDRTATPSDSEHALRLEAARQGQNDWLKSQNPQKRTLAYPNASEYEGKQTRSFMIPFETMLYIRECLGVGIDDKVTKFEITPKSLKTKIEEDLENLGLGKWKSGYGYFDYLDSFSPDTVTEEFKDWMTNVATVQFHNNDAWGETAIKYLKYNGISLDQPMSMEDRRSIADLSTGILRIQELKTVDELLGYRKVKGILNSELLEALVITHGNWRISKYFRKDPHEVSLWQANSILPDFMKASKDLSTNNFDELFPQLQNVLNTLKQPTIDTDEIKTLIAETRDPAHLNPEIPAGATFALLVFVAARIEEAAKLRLEATEGNPDQDKNYKSLIELRDDYLQVIKMDANVSIYKAIEKFFSTQEKI